MATDTSKPVHSLVLDTGPLIKNDPTVSSLLAQAEVLYTIPAVIEEIRDAATRSRLETTLKPFLKIRSPSAASIKVISDFARRTGDLDVLSRPDIHVMALAYELECERNQGDWRLRSVPGQKRLNGKPPAKDAEGKDVPSVEATESIPPVVNSTPAPIPESRGAWGTSIPTLPDSLEETEAPSPSEEATQEKDDAKNPDTTPAEGPSTILEENTETKEESTSTLEESQVAAPTTTLEETLANTHLDSSAALDSTSELVSSAPANEETNPIFDSTEEVPESETEDSDGGEWITPSNIKKHQEKDNNTSLDPEEKTKTMQVATITSDYAMQNVLLRMNLNLLSPKLMRVRELKSWVLRCHACFFISKDMTKQFCPRCGKPSLMRASCSTDKDGNFKVHLKKNMQYNTRGNVYSIPKPVAGTANGKLVSGGGKGGWGQGLILAEDQKEYVQAMTGARRKKEKDLMDEDYLPSILTGDRAGGHSKPKVGAGRNVNSKKRNR